MITFFFVNTTNNLFFWTEPSAVGGVFLSCMKAIDIAWRWLACEIEGKNFPSRLLQFLVKSCCEVATLLYDVVEWSGNGLCDVLNVKIRNVKFGEYRVMGNAQDFFLYLILSTLKMLSYNACT